jgi:5-methylcytosine-specific restriction protein A
MPPSPPKPCKKQGCRAITTNPNGFCDAHQDEAKQLTEQAKRFRQKRISAAQRGYGTHWQRVRSWQLAQHPLCEMCQHAAIVVHHKDHNQFNNSPDNLMSLCRDCHERIHKRKK